MSPKLDDRRPSKTRCLAVKRDARARTARGERRRRSKARFPPAWSRRCSAWAASGAPSGSSGRTPASTRPRSATRAATRRTRPTKKSAPGVPGHAEVVLVVFDPAKVTYEELLKRFWENHDPTQGMRQGNDVGTQYRSAIYVYSDEQRRAAERSNETCTTPRCGSRATGRSRPRSCDAPPFYYAEAYHQQYLAKNPGGYCGLGGTGVKCSL